MDIGEVIESTTAAFVVQCWELHASPPFGSFVRTDSEPAVFGLVSAVTTRSVEPNRRPTAYRKTGEELMREQPQIFELLKTECEALVVGYQDHAAIRQTVPPQPPKIHTFVRPCSVEETKVFTDHWDFLRGILTSNAPTDELIIAAVRHAYSAHDHDVAYLVQAGKELSRLIRDDYDRLDSIIRRVAQ
ncbi:MAG: hypothetical protein V1800_11695 [Candidatus Latescibacterota bacterium]